MDLLEPRLSRAIQECILTGEQTISTELIAAYEGIEEDKARFRQMRDWLLCGNADDMVVCLDLIDAALD